jgi:luciferase family oxidoreductase group 1
MSLRCSVLDLATVDRGANPGDALQNTVTLARAAERRGYARVWYAEHHNIRSIASSATSVLIAHVAANTTTIRLGSGGIMLPNHSPLTIAEQFGTLELLHPGRIDLGLGRAPGTDQQTVLALRRHPAAAERFPQDVVELQAYLAGESVVEGVEATPGAGTRVPLYILGSSLFGAQLAAVLGLPYGFASHFAPAALHEAVAVYRERFRPSTQLEQPYVIAGVNAIAAPTRAEAEEEALITSRRRVRILVGRDRSYTDEEADRILASPQGAYLRDMARYTAVGTPDEVAAYLTGFAADADADELMIAFQSPSAEGRVRSLELVADALGLAP